MKQVTYYEAINLVKSVWYMVLRFSISAMIYIFDYPPPSHQFPQSQIAGSSTYVGHCKVGWPNATFASGIYQGQKYLDKAFGQSQSFSVFGAGSNIQTKFCIRDHPFKKLANFHQWALFYNYPLANLGPILTNFWPLLP